MTMTTSLDGLRFIAAEEGVVLTTYRDAADVLTIGVGHTVKAGLPAPKAGMAVTLGEALAIFARDIAKYEAEVTAAIRAPLAQHEFDALVAFHYNTGNIRGGSVDDKLNRGDRSGAMLTLQSYCKARDPKTRKLVKVEGLLRRRQREAALFMRGDYAPRPIGVYDRYPGKARPVAWQRFALDEAAPVPPPKPVVVPPPPDVEPVTPKPGGPVAGQGGSRGASLGAAIAAAIAILTGGVAYVWDHIKEAVLWLLQ